jgi:2,3-bisphosphoglycerate-dependent phosphoglycerate mutase
VTTIYFVRHAEADLRNHNDELRELTAKGLRDRGLVTNYLRDKGIDAILSSPYRRAVDTVQDLADYCGAEIGAVPDFRERRVGDVWIDDFDAFSRRQWADFDYKLDGGETLAEVQARNIAALQAVLLEYPGQNVVIGSHGTALSTVINYYDDSFGYADFERIKALMPWIARFNFEATSLKEIDLIDVYTARLTRRYPAAPSRG